MSRHSFIAILVLGGTAFAAAADISNVNGSIEVTAAQPAGNVSTVNGAIHVEDHAVIANASTVNGGITLGVAAAAQSLGTVNGAISVGSGSRIAGTVSTVNGSITLQRSADVSGHLGNVNGRIYLDGAHVGSGIETVSGVIEIGAHSRVEGGILVKHSCTEGFWNWLFPHRCEPSLVVIGPDAVVQGTLRFEHEVKLYVSTRARIGPVEVAKAIVYSGERPPV